jgi:iron only hydrogenase large subunit-like protein
MDEIYLNKLDLLISQIESALKTDKTVIVQTAPALRVSLGEIFGRPVGEDNTKKVVGVLKELGFKHVIDTSLGADVASYLEAQEFIKYMNEGNETVFPKFNSCCIGWMMYVKRKHPELMNSLCPVMSPNLIAGGLAKLYMSKKLGKKPEDIIVVSIMPCTLKKYETLNLSKNGMKYVDYVLTTVELSEWIKRKKINFNEVKEQDFDSILPHSSKSGIIFGATGGVAESIVSAAAHIMKKEIEVTDLRNDNDIYRKKYKLDGHEISVAKVWGYKNLELILDEVKQGEFYHFIEVMQCPMGCVGGPGQPLTTPDNVKKRAEGMRSTAQKSEIKTSIEIKELENIINSIFEEHGNCALKFSDL